MDASMWVAKTGLDAQQTRMNVISNNLANVTPPVLSVTARSLKTFCTRTSAKRVVRPRRLRKLPPV